MQVDNLYVMHLMNGLDFKDLSVWGELGTIPRDDLFKDLLESFNKKPLKIFQIGAIESLSSQYRIGSGWSELFWGEYIKQNGGELAVVDINIDHIAHSSFLATNFQYQTYFHVNDAINVIADGYDIYYLDGADISQISDAHEQTLNQFKKIEHTKSLVIVDDVPTKAKLLVSYLDERGIAYKNHDHANGMITIDLRGLNE